MAFARARRGITRGRSQRGGTNWGRLVLTAPVTVAAGTKVALISITLDNVGISETVRRTRGRFFITSDQGAAQEQQIGAIGAIVVNDLALAAGAASIAGPVTDADDDGWFVWESFAQMSGANDGGGVSISLPPGQYEFDSKAMRRIEDGFVAVIMVENAHATDGLTIAMGVSLLTSRA